MNDYPETICPAEIDAIAVDPVVLAAVRRFAAARPWRGTVAERKAKFRTAAHDICAAAGRPAPRIVFAVDERIESGRSCCIASGSSTQSRADVVVFTCRV